MKTKAPPSKENAAKDKISAKEKAKISSQEPSLETEIKKSLHEGKAGQRKKAAMKRNIRIVLAVLGALFIAWFYNWLFAYAKGDMRYGVCKTFVELYVRNPIELRLTTTESFGRMFRVWYVDHNAYGERNINSMDCYYQKRDDGRLRLEKVALNRRELGVDMVKQFNKGIPAIFAYKPDLTLPQGLPDGLSELRLGK